MSKLERIRAICANDPNNAFAWYSLAMEEKKEDRARALAAFEHLHRQVPDYLPAYYHYGKTLEEDGQAERAREILREGIALAETKGDGHTRGELLEVLQLLED